MICVLCEGPSETNFVKIKFGSEKFYAINLKGGLDWQKIKQMLPPLLKANDFVTTFFDLAKLSNNFPLSSKEDKYEKVDEIEKAMFREVKNEKFIPYIQLHEFETLFFADEDAVKSVLEKRLNAENIAKDYNHNIELINSNYLPAKRLEKLGYNKLLHTEHIMQKLNLERVKASCKHFKAWVEKLENLCKH